MRQRPLCFGFLGLIVIILLLRALGLPTWQSPDGRGSVLLKSDSGESFQVYGTVTAREEKTNSISYILSDAWIQDPDQNSNSYFIHNVLLYFSKTEDRISVGSEILVTGTVNALEHESNPGGFDVADYYAGVNCYARMYGEAYELVKDGAGSLRAFFSDLRGKFQENLESSMGSEGSSVLSAMLLGVRSGMEEEVRLDYSAMGLSHLLSISGLHISLFGMALYRFLLRCRAGFLPASIGSIFIMSLYCVFTGAGEATVRAAIMYAVLLLGKVLRRSYDPLSALSLAGIILLILRPMSLLRAGFQLSFLAAGAAACVYPKLRKAAEGGSGKKCLQSKLAREIFGQLRESTLLWLSVNLLTFPVVLYHFQEFPLWSLPANLLFLPLASIMLILGMLGLLLSLFCQPAAFLLLKGPDLFFSGISEAGTWIRRLPSSTLVCGRPENWQLCISAAGVVLFLMALGWETKKRKEKNGRSRQKASAGILRLALPAALVLFAAAPFPSGFSMTALDVGQGDCIAIQSGEGHAFLVDCGSSSEENIGRYTLETYLKFEGIRELEAVFLTHADADHLNGISEELQRIAQGTSTLNIRRIFMPSWMRESAEGAQVLEEAKRAGCPVLFLQEGDEITDGRLQIQVLGPRAGSELTGNAGSLVLSVEYEGFRALLTGDLEEEGEEALAGRLGKCDYLKAAHHGSRFSTSEAFLRETKPRVCVFSAPLNSLYGHPHPETIKRVEESGASWYQTGQSGAVRVSVKNKKMYLDTWKA